jgi:phosphoribosyl-ATP pyrophosphohydrolase
MGYHKTNIPKGLLGQFSKIKEEFLELEDAVDQQDKILVACELSDLIGAIKHFSVDHLGLSLVDLVIFNDKTEEAFKEGKRGSK